MQASALWPHDGHTRRSPRRFEHVLEDAGLEHHPAGAARQRHQRDDL
jgi:hypothetical protein